MSTTGGWPDRPAPQPPGSPPQPGQAPAAASFPTRPSGPPPTAAPPTRRRLPAIEAKVVIVALIGVVSVSGALLTWQAALLGEEATDRDRQSLAETVNTEQVAARINARVETELQAFAQFKQDLVLAAGLASTADRLTDQGRDDEAADAAEAANVRREVADNLALLTFPLDYVDGDQDTGEVAFDERRRRDDLVRAESAELRVDPDVTAAEADERRDESQRLVGLIIPLALAVFVLTLAQLMRSARLRPLVAGVGVVVWLGAGFTAIFG